MKRELNKIFDVKSREARRDILNKFDLTSDDKNKVLNKIVDANNTQKTIYYEFNDFFKDENASQFIELFNNLYFKFFTHFKLFKNGKYHFIGAAAFMDILNNEDSANLNAYGYSINDIVMGIFEPMHYIYGNAHAVYNSFEEVGEVSSVYIKRHITAEEYYNIQIPGLKIFNIVRQDAGTNQQPIFIEFYYKEGMTWEDWFNSEYNTIPFLRKSNVNLTDNVTMGSANNVPVWQDYIYGFDIISPESGFPRAKWNDIINSVDYGMSIIG